MITGSSKGFGRQLANTFAKHGHNVILHGRDLGRLVEVSKEVDLFGVESSVIQGDIKEMNTIDRLLTVAREKNVGILINNAANSTSGVPISQMERETLEDIILTNVLGTILLSRGMFQYFAQRGKGCIIIMNSLFSLELKKNSAAYSASKWGLRGFAETMRLEGRDHNIGVMDVYPSKILLPGGKYGMDAEEAAEKLYLHYRNGNFQGLFFDGRPDGQKPKLGTEPYRLKDGLVQVPIDKRT